MVKALASAECDFCLIGGHAASLYRAQERFTRDVDFALVAHRLEDSKNVASQCISDVGLKPVVAFIPRGDGEPDRNSICLVTSKPEVGASTGIVDVLLPDLPWISEAVQRAQFNLIDLQFAKVPVITPEDLILAKCYALRNSPERFQDLDDLKSIFESISDLDLDYLKMRLSDLSLCIPQQIVRFAPKSLRF